MIHHKLSNLIGQFERIVVQVYIMCVHLFIYFCVCLANSDFCGNGVVEGSEQCDCGTNCDNDPCCVGSNCTLTSGSQCR